jgi:hypothetical protein
MPYINTTGGYINFLQDPNTYQGQGIDRYGGGEFVDTNLGQDEMMRQAFQNKLAGNENAFNYWKDFLKTENVSDNQINNSIKDQSYNQLLSETVTNGKVSDSTLKNVYRVLGEQGYDPENIATQYKSNMENFYDGERERANRHHTGFSAFLEKAMPGIALSIVTGGIGSGLGLFGGSALGAGVGSEIGALAADAAIQAGLGAGGAGLAGAGIGSEIGALASDAAIQEGLNQGVAQLGAGTSLSADAATNPLNPFYSTSNPTTAANLNTVSNLVGGGAEFNLGALNSLASNPLIPLTGAGIGGAGLGATGSIIGSGNGLGVNTLADTLAPTGLNGLTPLDLSSQPNFEPSIPSTTNAKDVADALRRANQLKNILTASNPTASKTGVGQQPQALSNLLRANQFTPIASPEIYKAQNPFSFGQQQPIQDTNQLASLLRNNYGNS